ncbi:MAG: hypothetical protein A2X81_16380 [Desulfobacterales bacterium GWB2_56_26]|nr:MAG: hypothetical protein A2X81_16380 [Desulfobacterales bacterium GWB2_56_26]
MPIAAGFLHFSIETLPFIAAGNATASGFFNNIIIFQIYTAVYIGERFCQQSKIRRVIYSIYH